jgi:dynein heavy chain, axonemal
MQCHKCGLYCNRNQSRCVQDYLETKRIAFPRFYFVAPADLLDILSKGSNPQLILRHLSKCFDSVCNMEFRLNDKGDPTKAALAMFDPKGEKVHFAGLNRLTCTEDSILSQL